MMFASSTFVFAACRGIGKTFLSAIYCVTRAILWPGTRICIVSGTRNQSINVLEKILQELKPLSSELRSEINEKETQINGTKAQIVFNNNSVIKVVTANDGARGNRCHVLLIDEYRLVKKDMIDTTLRKFLTLRRMPQYKDISEEDRKKEWAKEKNLTMYLSSAYFKSHWSYTKLLDTFKAMLDPSRRQFVCGFPYQLSIEEGLLDPELVADEMSESDFSEVKFDMEMSALWYGSEEGAFFDFASISNNRKIKYPMLPDEIAAKLNNSPLVKIQPKQNGEVRIMSVDVALMASRKHDNDAASVFINCMIPTKSGRYYSNITYTYNLEGMLTQDLALEVRSMFDEYMCDYLVLDCSGNGQGVFDILVRDISDPNTGEIYPAISCCNNSDMAARCTISGAKKVIWTIKANAQFNSDCAFLLREGIRSGQIRLLDDEFNADDYLSEIKTYKTLDPHSKTLLQLPYINTTLLVNELINLQHEEVGGRVKIFEKSGMRKDRYSSLAYNYYVAKQIEQQLNKKKSNSSLSSESFVIKPPNYKGKAVGDNSVKEKKSWW